MGCVMMVIEWYFEMQKRDRKGMKKKLSVNFDAIVGVCCVRVIEDIQDGACT